MYISNYADEKSIKQIKDVDVLLESWEMFYRNFSCKPDATEFPKYKKGDIIDENQSVKWNREEIERRIAARDAEVKRLNTIRNKLHNLYETTCIKLLAKEYKILTEEAEIIWKKAYEDEHAFGVKPVYSEFRELADMYADLRKVVEIYDNLKKSKENK